jgi:hypothetical protein
VGGGENEPEAIPNTLPPPKAGAENASGEILVKFKFPPLVSVIVIEFDEYEELIFAPADIAAEFMREDKAEPLTAGYPRRVVSAYVGVIVIVLEDPSVIEKERLAEYVPVGPGELSKTPSKSGEYARFPATVVFCKFPPPVV